MFSAIRRGQKLGLGLGFGLGHEYKCWIRLVRLVEKPRSTNRALLHGRMGVPDGKKQRSL